MVKNRVKELRTERNLTQEKLCELTGLSRTTLSKIENNDEVNVNTRTIAKLSEVLETDPFEIFLM